MALESVTFEQVELKTSENAAQKTLKKIISNLRAYLKDKTFTIEHEEIVKQKYFNINTIE